MGSPRGSPFAGQPDAQPADGSRTEGLEDTGGAREPAAAAATAAERQHYPPAAAPGAPAGGEGPHGKKRPRPEEHPSPPPLAPPAPFLAALPAAGQAPLADASCYVGRSLSGQVDAVAADGTALLVTVQLEGTSLEWKGALFCPPAGWQEPTALPSAPLKRPRTPYNFFSDAVRPGVKAQHPHMETKVISKLVGDMWAQLGAEEREQYHEAARQDRERYERELRQYQARFPQGVRSELQRHMRSPAVLQDQQQHGEPLGGGNRSRGSSRHPSQQQLAPHASPAPSPATTAPESLVPRAAALAGTSSSLAQMSGRLPAAPLAASAAAAVPPRMFPPGLGFDSASGSSRDTSIQPIAPGVPLQLAAAAQRQATAPAQAMLEALLQPGMQAPQHPAGAPQQPSGTAEAAVMQLLTAILGAPAGPAAASGPAPSAAAPPAQQTQGAAAPDLAPELVALLLRLAEQQGPAPPPPPQGRS